jgi:integrase
VPAAKLTDRFIAGLRPTKRSVYFDSKAKGLALRVSPNGTKAWAFVYRTAGRGPQWVTLGAYPALTLVDARAEALSKRHAIDVEKRDPAAEERATRAARVEEPQPTAAETAPKAFTFIDLLKLYETFAKGRKKTWKDDIGMAKKHLVPSWGAMPVKAITRAHVHELLDTLVGKGMTTGVNRVQAVISRMFTIALDRSLVDAHPAARMIKRFQEQPSDRVLSDGELRALWAGLDARPGPAADAVKLRLLLGQRGSEVMGMRWTEVDLKAAVWSMPGARTKNSRPHFVPLPRTALGILERRRKETPAKASLVFDGITQGSDEHRVLSEIHAGSYTWKDLRRTVSTRLAARGFTEEVIGRALNHARYTVTARHYIKHDYLAEVRRALETWDADLADIIAGRDVAPTAVLPFRR